MSAHRLPDDFNRLYATGSAVIADPGSGGTFDLGPCPWGGIATIASGTRKLPSNVNLGSLFYVYATGSVTIQNQAAGTVATLSQSEVGIFIARSTSEWGAIILPESGSIGIAVAADIPIEDLTGYTASTNVNDALEDNYVYGQFPNAQFTTSSTITAVTAAADILTGARHVYWQNTADGAVALTPRTATQMYGDLGDAAFVGMSYELTIVNRGDNTVTLQAATGITYTGELTVATTTTRTYAVTFTSATAATVVAVNKGTIET